MQFNLKEIQAKYNLNIKGLIHIGAHYGEEYGNYKKLDIKNLLFFEPIPECFKILKKNVEGLVINKALGNFNGKVKMYIANNKGQSSSLLIPKLHKTQYPNIIFDEIIEVDIIRLDDFLKVVLPLIHNGEKYNFITIDVQGYELEVFKGAVKTLENIDYIISEVNRVELYDDCVRVDELDNFLKQFGFNRVETAWADKYWGDAIYIR